MWPFRKYPKHWLLRREDGWRQLIISWLGWVVEIDWRTK